MRRKEKPVFKQGKRPVGDLIDGEVFADRHLGCFPHKGAVGGVQLDQQGAMRYLDERKSSPLLYPSDVTRTLIIPKETSRIH